MILVLASIPSGIYDDMHEGAVSSAPLDWRGVMAVLVGFAVIAWLSRRGRIKTDSEKETPRQVIPRRANGDLRE